MAPLKTPGHRPGNDQQAVVRQYFDELPLYVVVKRVAEKLIKRDLETKFPGISTPAIPGGSTECPICLGGTISNYRGKQFELRIDFRKILFRLFKAFESRSNLHGTFTDFALFSKLYYFYIAPPVLDFRERCPILARILDEAPRFLARLVEIALELAPPEKSPQRPTWLSTKSLIEEQDLIESALKSEKLPRNTMLISRTILAAQNKILFGVPHTELARLIFKHATGSPQSQHNLMKRRIHEFDQLKLTPPPSFLGPVFRVVDGYVATKPIDMLTRDLAAFRKEWGRPLEYADSVRRLSLLIWKPCESHSDEFVHRWLGERRLSSNFKKHTRIDPRRKTKSVSSTLDPADNASESRKERLYKLYEGLCRFLTADERTELGSMLSNTPEESQP